jgi:hypothetical protein
LSSAAARITKMSKADPVETRPKGSGARAGVITVALILLQLPPGLDAPGQRTALSAVMGFLAVIATSKRALSAAADIAVLAAGQGAVYEFVVDPERVPSNFWAVLGLAAMVVIALTIYATSITAEPRGVLRWAEGPRQFKAPALLWISADVAERFRDERPGDAKAAMVERLEDEHWVELSNEVVASITANGCSPQLARLELERLVALGAAHDSN